MAISEAELITQQNNKMAEQSTIPVSALHQLNILQLNHEADLFRLQDKATQLH